MMKSISARLRRGSGKKKADESRHKIIKKFILMIHHRNGAIY